MRDHFRMVLFLPLITLLLSVAHAQEPRALETSAAAPSADSPLTPAVEPETPAFAEAAALPLDPWSPEIKPLSFFIAYGFRLDVDHHAANGTAVGIDYRIARRISLQIQDMFGYRAEGVTDFSGRSQLKTDLWSTLNYGVKWDALYFAISAKQMADVYLTGGGVTATSTGDKMRSGTQLFAGLGATYFFEPAVKAILDVRGTPGHRSYDQFVVGMNFQF